MSYPMEYLGGTAIYHVAADNDDLSATGVHTTSVAMHDTVQVKRISVLVTTAVVSTGAVVVTFKKYITYGSATGAVTLGTVSVPAGTAVGKVVYKNITPVAFAAGDQLIFEVTTAAAGGGAAGGANYGFSSHDSPEVPVNESDMIASA